MTLTRTLKKAGEMKLVAWLVIALKSSKIIKAIKLLKLFKFAKPFVTMISIVLSLFAYSLAYNFLLGTTLVVLMFVHELGHVFAINKQGFKVNGMLFIPFFGAAIFPPKGMNRDQEAIIATGGPLLGSIFSLIIILSYLITGYPLLLVIGYLGVILNLFNMIPVSPLDGGRITQAVGTYFNVGGIILLIGLTISLKQPSLLLVWVLAFIDFKLFTIRIRMYIVAAIILSMIFFLISGIGISEKGDFWILLFDSLFGALYFCLLVLSYINNKEETRKMLNEGHERPGLNKSKKIKWFIVWLVITATLIAVLISLEPIIINLKPHV